MQEPLLDRIANLERKVRLLKERMEEADRTDGERNAMQIDLDIAQRALVHFRRALEREPKLSN
jgi:hypothetical protein